MAIDAMYNTYLVTIRLKISVDNTIENEFISFSFPYKLKSQIFAIIINQVVANLESILIYI